MSTGISRTRYQRTARARGFRHGLVADPGCTLRVLACPPLEDLLIVTALREMFGDLDRFGRAAAAEPPLENSYWVLPGRLLAGDYPFGEDPVQAHDRLARLRAAGIDAFVDLTEMREMPSYRRLLPRACEYKRFAIADGRVPLESTLMRAIQAHIGEALGRERHLYVHCRAGIGRTGLVIGCFLADEGLGGKAALKTLNRLWRRSARSKSWPRVPQTEEQAKFVLAWAARRA